MELAVASQAYQVRRRFLNLRASPTRYWATSTLDQVMATIASEMESRGQITLAQVRDLFGTSRRYAQALLEHMDSEGMTLRVGDARRLRKRRRT